MIRILFFAQLREQIGVEAIEWPLGKSKNIKQLCAELVISNPSWEGILSSPKISCALNHSIVKFDALLNDGDEVAFFPPVTGG